MRIRRRGSERDHGWSEIVLQGKSSEFRWNDSEQTLCYKSFQVEDFSSNSHHDYEIHIGIEELTLLIESTAIQIRDLRQAEYIKNKLTWAIGKLTELQSLANAAKFNTEVKKLIKFHIETSKPTDHPFDSIDLSAIERILSEDRETAPKKNDDS
ncbi:hypothetical protein AB1L88_11140 [Tautonia sp. JC769]|uniref:hypothetical protein n=1 Tax=Tautonia sp. JC769 TaxID=3232135 RepID=UPI00345873A2